MQGRRSGAHQAPGARPPPGEMARRRNVGSARPRRAAQGRQGPRYDSRRRAGGEWRGERAHHARGQHMGARRAVETRHARPHLANSRIWLTGGTEGVCAQVRHGITARPLRSRAPSRAWWWLPHAQTHLGCCCCCCCCTCCRGGEGGSSSGGVASGGRAPHTMVRVHAVSDVHTDHASNLAWVEALAGERASLRDDVLLLAGDVSDDLGTLERTLAPLAGAFGAVAFVPGNHDVWVGLGVGGWVGWRVGWAGAARQQSCAVEGGRSHAPPPCPPSPAPPFLPRCAKPSAGSTTRWASCSACATSALGWACTPPPRAWGGCGWCRCCRGTMPRGTGSQMCRGRCPSTRWAHERGGGGEGAPALPCPACLLVVCECSLHYR